MDIERKKGQIQLSFGMIFSIIIIIATIGVAFYVISNFLHLSDCIDSGVFYKDIENEVNKAWSSPITKSVFSSKVPDDVEAVCFGSLKDADKNLYTKEYENLRYFINQDANVFIYPSTSACGNSLIYYKLKNANISEFFCAPSVNGKITVKIFKEFDDSKVRISK